MTVVANEVSSHIARTSAVVDMPSWAPFMTTISDAMSRYTSRKNGRDDRSMTPADLGNRMRAVSDAHRHGS